MSLDIQDKVFTADGLKFKMLLGGVNLVLPVEDMQRDSMDEADMRFLLELNLLWMNDKLIELPEGYHIDIGNIQKNPILIEKLEVPHMLDGLDGMLTHKSFIGNKNFSMDLAIKKECEDIRIINREGCYILSNKGAYILPKNIVKIMDLVERVNTAATSSLGQFEILAKIKNITNNNDRIQLDSYLNNEEVYFPNTLDLDVEKVANDEIKIKTHYKELPENINETINHADGPIGSFTQTEGNNRKRIFLDETQKTNLSEVKSHSTIKGSDVPKFIQNPEAFISENLDIDISEFSKRVKGLNILSYRAQPFVSVRPNKDRDWFSFESGIELIQENDADSERSQMDMEAFSKLVDEAKENNEDYVYFEDKWVHINAEDGKEFIKANNELAGVVTDQGIHRSKLNGVLEIYQNIDQLEYNEEFFAIREKLEKEGNYALPDNLKADLYAHQVIGYNWLRNLKELKLGGLLADDMGLGKTLQLISLIAYHKTIGELKPSLIVVPSILIQNWWEELHKFIADTPKVYVHHGPGRMRNQEWMESQDLVITTYETLKRDQLIMGKINWEILICDEAQKIKNPTTVVSNAVKAMKSKYKYSMTGTPVENSLVELWSIVDFIQPGYLNSLSEFKKRYVRNSQEEDFRVYEELRKRIEPVFLRREKKDILKELPEKESTKVECILSQKQKNIYGEIIAEARETKNFLGAVQKLIQVCSHPNLIEKDFDVSDEELVNDCPKLRETMDIIAAVKEKDEKVLIFTKYIEMQKILQRVILKRFNTTPHIINGQVTSGRQQLIHWFNSTKGFRVLILSPRAAGVGLNITSANHVIHYTREWNPAIENQATDRAHRIGQKKEVHIYYPITVDNRFETAEQKINDLLEEKMQMYNNVMIPTGKLEISKDDLMGILNVTVS